MCAPKITIYDVPLIQSETDIIFCDFGWSFAILSTLLPPSSPPPPKKKNQNTEKMNKMPGDIILLYIHVYHKWRSYDIWFLKYKVWQTEIFVILGHFLSFQPLDNLANQNFDSEKNTWRYYHGSWDMKCNRLNFFSFWTVFCPFTPLWTQKIKILEKWGKKAGDIIILQ